MKISLNGSIKKIIWLSIMSIFFVAIVYNESSWGKYAILLASILIAILSAILKEGNIRIHIEPFHIFSLLFCGYTLLSSLWAIVPDDAVVKATTVFQIFACTTMIYTHYQDEENVHDLLIAVMWAGYLIAIYTIWLYGFDDILGAISGKRMSGAYNNANTIGMAVAVSCMLQMNEILNKRMNWSALLMIPSVLVVLATQSRKAMVMIAVGIFLMYVIRNMQSKEDITKIVKVLASVAVMLCLLYQLSRLPALSVIHERINVMIEGLFGDDSTDGSTSERLAMIRLGWEIFKGNPLFGIGMGNAHVITAQRLGTNTYLHNNFVEILSGGGIVGFCLYYGMYVYVAVNLFKHRDLDREYFAIGLTWLIVLLISDFGYVSYYLKVQWFYLLIHFLNVRCIKKKSKECGI